MLSEKDLIFFGAVMIWASSQFVGSMDIAVEQSKKMYNKIFNNE